MKATFIRPRETQEGENRNAYTDTDGKECPRSVPFYDLTIERGAIGGGLQEELA